MLREKSANHLRLVLHIMRSTGDHPLDGRNSGVGVELFNLKLRLRRMRVVVQSIDDSGAMVAQKHTSHLLVLSLLVIKIM
jgi:environmental stress-induced protein Ves